MLYLIRGHNTLFSVISTSRYKSLLAYGIKEHKIYSKPVITNFSVCFYDHRRFESKSVVFKHAYYASTCIVSWVN